MRNLIWGFILVVFGTLMLLNNLGIADFGEVMANYWPVLLILWGILVLTRKRKSKERADANASQVPPPPPPPATMSGGIEEDLVHHSNVFGDLWLNVTSQNFKGGSVSTVFGDSTVNLSQAAFAEGEHILRVHGVFGNSTVILPKDAAVTVSANSTFGDVTIFDKHKKGFSSDLQSTSGSYESSPRKLKLVVSKVFGEVRVY